MKLLKKIITAIKSSDIIMYSATAAAAFYFFYLFCSTHDIQILDPSYTNWLYNQAEITFHYIGGAAYINSDWKLFPGMQDQLLYPIQKSVIYTDSIPLLALFFKIISPILPDKFQYFGIWGALCFILQGLLAAKIIKYHTDNKLVIIASGLFFTISPIMMRRMYWQTALAGQWILLLALEPVLCPNNYKNNDKKLYIKFALIGALASLIHGYFNLMCGITVLGFCLYDIIKTKKIKKSIFCLLIFTASAFCSFAFMGGIDSEIEQLKNDFDSSMNLNAYFDSMSWSVYFPKLKTYNQAQNDGFMYLGLGGFVLAASAVSASLIYFKNFKLNIKNNLPTISALIFISVLSVMISLSPAVTINENVLFVYPLPESVKSVWAIFKNTGRIAWISVYVLMFSSYITLIKHIKNYFLITFSAIIILALQTADQLNHFEIGRIETKCGEAYTNYLDNNSLWNELEKNKDIKHLVYTIPMTASGDEKLFALGTWAAEHKKTVNTFFTCRPIKKDVLYESINNSLNRISPDTVYVFFPKNKELCFKYKLNYYRDGFFIVGTVQKLKNQTPMSDYEILNFKQE